MSRNTLLRGPYIPRVVPREPVLCDCRLPRWWTAQCDRAADVRRHALVRTPARLALS